MYYIQQGWGQVQLTKYSSTPSTQNIYQVQVLVKYSFLKKYLSTSSTFISSTSTITHIKIGSKVRMDIQSRVNFGWTKQKQKGFPQIMSWLKSQFRNLDGHILCRVDFGLWMDKIKGLSQIMSLFKSQDGHFLCRVNLDLTKYRGVISWSGYMASGYIFTSPKKITDYL